MKKGRKQNQGARLGFRGYGNGIIIIIVSLCVLLYLVVLHLHKSVFIIGYDAHEIWRYFTSDIIKCTVMVLAGALFWYFIATQDYHTTFADLMDILSVKPGEKDESKAIHPYSTNRELDKLLDSANIVMHTNQIYKTQLDKQNKLLLENYLMRLMKGRIRDIPAAYESSESLGVDLRAKSLQVIVFGIDKGDEHSASEDTVNHIHQMLRTLICSMLFAAFKGYITEVDSMTACLLTPLTDENLASDQCATEVKRIATLIQQSILEKAELSVRVAIGSVSVGIAGVEKSFSEALELFQYAEITMERDCVFVYREMPAIHMVDTEDYFWFKKEMQFMNCINTEDYHSASTIFCEIIDSEYIRKDLPLKLANCRMMGLINSMVNALGRVRLTMDAEFFEKLDPWDTILNCKSIPELRKLSQDIFNCIISYSENQKKQSPYDRITIIIAYLKENYSEPNLSVSSIADHFHLNPSYLSRTFKKLTGIGLAEYLQMVRIDEAAELMKDKNISVKSVSEQVGYSSVLTMNRAFKKYKGTTAGRFKNFAQKPEDGCTDDIAAK